MLDKEDVMPLGEEILRIFTKHDYFPNSVAHLRLAGDIAKLGWETVKKLSTGYSPSQLGRMRLLGVRVLAKLRRDDPDTYKKIVEELDKILL